MFRRRNSAKEAEPVRNLLRSLSDRRIQDSFTRQLSIYLDWAAGCGLEGRHIADSCIDLALTLSTDPFIYAFRQEKIRNWTKARSTALTEPRPARDIHMKLDPEFFDYILHRKKTFEGRSYHPGSRHRYADIRPGDRIYFSIDRRLPSWRRDCAQRGIDPSAIMQGVVGQVHFAPLVHWMYQFNDCEADMFQPGITGTSEMLQLQRAGVYYQFPDYPGRIREHGFLGIEIANPRLIRRDQTVNFPLL